ncbi:hypothetical protein [Edwardsiella piscicida]|uniref:hypothetical protein n=1 Tax=Edwardsiella piscicida TaxID=1263550 RepID=UPI002923FF97|nr:hypothetical protein Q8004_01190 [Edwardsiella piscicida]
MDLILAIEHWPLRQAIVALYRRQFTIISLPDAVPFSPAYSVRCSGPAVCW